MSKLSVPIVNMTGSAHANERKQLPGRSIHRHSLSVLLAIWGEDGGGVTVAADPANLILTGQEVLLLRGQTGKQE